MSYLNLKMPCCTGITSLTLKNTNTDNPESTNHLIDMLGRMLNLSRLSLHGSSLDFTGRLWNELNDPDTVGLGLFKIRALDLSSMLGVCDTVLSFILKSCPNVEDLNLSSMDLSSRVFTSIETLSRLVALKVGYPTQRTIEFDSNIEHCLMTIGANLIILDISEFQRVPMPVLLKCCPILKELCMNGCTFRVRRNDFDDDADEDDDIFDIDTSYSMLHTLEIGSAILKPRTSRDIQDFEVAREKIYVRRVIKQIQHFFIEPSSQCIEKLRIGNCDKSLILKSLVNKQGNPAFSGLIDLDLSGNTCITKPDVIQILMACPVLKYLSLLNTGLTRQEIDSLKILVHKSKIITELRFSSH